MSAVSIDRKEKRFLTQDSQISRRTYNLVLCGTLLYGFIVNLILCITVKDVTKFINPWIFLLLYLILSQLGCFIATKSDNPFISFIGYNMIVVPIGLFLSFGIYQLFGGLSSDIVINAFLITACITALMTIFAIIKPDLCCKLGGIIGIMLCSLLCTRIILLILGIRCVLVSWFGALTFTLCFAYDVYCSQQYPPTFDNAIDSAADIYIDIAGIFMNLLDILRDN